MFFNQFIPGEDGDVPFGRLPGESRGDDQGIVDIQRLEQMRNLFFGMWGNFKMICLPHLGGYLLDRGGKAPMGVQVMDFADDDEGDNFDGFFSKDGLEGLLWQVRILL